MLDEDTLIDACGEFSQAGIRECLGKKELDSHFELGFAQERRLGALSQRGRDLELDMTDAKINLALSNQAFSTYRDVQCAFSASLSGGGNGRSITHPACVAALNGIRTAQLNAARDDWNSAIPEPPVLDEQVLTQICDKSSQADMYACLRGKIQDSEQALQQSERKMLNALSQWSEDERYILESKIRLAVSGQAFSSYREVECKTFVSHNENDRVHSNPTCVSELNYRRAAQLQYAASRMLQE